ncbi:curlin [Pseudomonas oryzihabitans]|nr:curlin [Pseudomonas psychrotolerans]
MPTAKFLTCLGLLGLTSTAWALDNQTLVDQRGDQLGAFLVQDADTRQGRLEVVQSGRVSQAYLTQSASLGDRTRVEQGGLGNFANVTQAAGGAREVAIDQREANQSHAYVYQGHGQRNQVEIVQAGLLNEALVRQGGDDQRMLIEQAGARNGIELFQDGSDSGSRSRLKQVGDDHRQDVLSLGARNEVDLLQGGAANQARVEQRGDDNYASARQGARQQELRLIQTGNGNDARVQQNGLGDRPQRLSTVQRGDDNTAELIVTGAGNTLDLQQQGNRNTAGVLIGGDDARLTLVSTGNDNTFRANGDGDDIGLSVTQLGDGHAFSASLLSAAQVEASQQGFGQRAVISQLSEGNSLSLRQSGQGNQATIQQ